MKVAFNKLRADDEKHRAIVEKKHEAIICTTAVVAVIVFFLWMTMPVVWWRRSSWLGLGGSKEGDSAACGSAPASDPGRRPVPVAVVGMRKSECPRP